MAGSVRCQLVRSGFGGEAFFGNGLEASVDGSVGIPDPCVDRQVALVVGNRGIGASVEEYSDAFGMRSCGGDGERCDADVVAAVDGTALVVECDRKDGSASGIVWFGFDHGCLNAGIAFKVGEGAVGSVLDELKEDFGLVGGACEG